MTRDARAAVVSAVCEAMGLAPVTNDPLDEGLGQAWAESVADAAINAVQDEYLLLPRQKVSA